jgi:hypothetical protein
VGNVRGIGEGGGVSGRVRPAWESVPVQVRAEVERACGSRITSARSLDSGFTPGVAAALDLADGTRRFVKAISPEPNPDSPQYHRQEIVVNGWLPADAPVPRLLWTHDDGTWVVLLFEHVDATNPAQPWQDHDLDLALEALAGLHALTTPAPAAAPDVVDAFADDFTGWRRLAAAPPAGLDGWSAAHLDRLGELEAEWESAIAGDTLIHCDVRADNLLIGHGRAWIVDWPWACRGAGWFDVVGMAPSVAMSGGPPPWETVARYPGALPDRQALTVAVAALAGFFTEHSLRPEEPGLPTVRAFQAAQAEQTRRWLDHLVGW